MSIRSKIQALISAANAKTGESDTTLTDAVQTLVDGYGQGGGGLDVSRLVSGTYSWGSVDTDGTIHKIYSTTGNIPLTKSFSVSNGDTIEVCFLKGVRQYASLALYSGSTQIASFNLGNVTPPIINGFTIEIDSDATIDNVVVSFNAIFITKIAVFINENLVLT